MRARRLPVLLGSLLLAVGLAATSAGPAVAGRPPRSTPTPTPSSSPATGGTLVLYDTTNAYAWLGQLYGTFTANLVSQFGRWQAQPVVSYKAGDMATYSAVVYVGSTYDEPLPAAFLDDVLAGSRPVIWVYDNIWQLGARPAFATTYGWQPGYFDLAQITRVDYKGRSLTRHPENSGGILGSTISDPAKVSVLAQAVRPDGTTLPWALRAGNLTYIGDMPYAYMQESDRYLILADLLFDALAPTRPERHRALVRFEDVGPDADPVALRAAADYLASKGIKFTVATYTHYRDPLGYYNGGVGEDRRMSEAPEVVDALKYLLTKGATLNMHGYTHQYENLANPYGGVSGDDFEFFRSHVDAADYVRLDGPVPLDSTSWALSRVDAARLEFCKTGLPQPTIFEFPHYAGSITDYKAIGTRFSTRYERALYSPGMLGGATPDQSRIAGQFFPYPVTDVYGQRVIPENLGDISPWEQNHHPARLPQDLLRAAASNLVVRDGFASFFWHPFLSLDYLKQTVEGLLALGYTFTDAPSLAAPATPVGTIKCGGKGQQKKLTGDPIHGKKPRTPPLPTT